MRRLLVIAIAMIAIGACSRVKGDWTSEEKSLINGSGDIMRVLTVADSADLAVLRGASRWLSEEDLQSREYQRLSEKMIATVTSPEQDGVGIAGPQVGISRRVVAVQRFDKEGEPFEVYPNITIERTYGETEPGPEGCLSVPGYRGTVSRYQNIDIKYTSLSSLRDTVENVQGFTAVIFQHETDHLAGIIYTDKADSLEVRN